MCSWGPPKDSILCGTAPINVHYMCIIPVKFTDYSRIMLHAFTDRLSRKLCRHIRRIPSHLGQHRTCQKVQCRFYWSRWTEYVQEWCLRCPECAKTKSSTAHAPLNFSQVGYPMEKVALEIFGPLPQTSEGNWYMLVITDYFTRWVEAFPMPNQEAPTIAKVLVREWICRYGGSGQELRV